MCCVNTDSSVNIVANVRSMTAHASHNVGGSGDTLPGRAHLAASAPVTEAEEHMCHPAAALALLAAHARQMRGCCWQLAMGMVSRALVRSLAAQLAAPAHAHCANVAVHPVAVVAHGAWRSRQQARAVCCLGASAGGSAARHADEPACLATLRFLPQVLAHAAALRVPQLALQMALQTAPHCWLHPSAMLGAGA